ncbi:ABC transporter permease [Spirosoma sp. BT702]|uniref:ABC transporter permease n=1 Tax=Spirosoma profusum TaxID=2771354 RepID=A0A927APX4_9BACT|nr:ABC transporter permease [Spirosoma profusum]MBD2699206.1 ABC transporter permease [Spirosoma profusum]
MLQNYFKIALRNLWRYRRVNLISIVGLSVGLACGIVIFLLVSYLFSFDQYHSKAKRTYWIVTDIRHENVTPTDATPRPLGEVLRRNYPFVESAVRLENVFRRVVGVPDGKGRMSKKFEESRTLCFTEPQFFDVFDVTWIAGDPKIALSSPNTVVLSERYAQKYFGTSQVVGRVLRFDNQVNLTVTGIIKNPPSNTKLRYECLISYSTLSTLSGTNGQQAMQSWDNVTTVCFVTLREGTPLAQLTNVLPAIRQKYLRTEEAKALDFHVLPLRDLSHNPQYGGESPYMILYVLIAVGLFLVGGACINFINVATAHALKRAKEVGVRKAVGSTRWQLIGQFMTETSLLTLVAVLLGMLLAQLGLPALNNALHMLNADLSILDLFLPRSLIWFLGLIIGVILLAGLYPSLVLARFKPVVALHGRMTTQQVGGLRVRRSLVVTQFFITQLFCIGVIVMMAQVGYMQVANLGFQKKSILTIPVPTDSPIKQQTLRARLGQIPGVEDVTLGVEPPAAPHRPPLPFTFDTHTQPEKFQTRVKVGDMNYLSVFDIKLLTGRNFRNNDTTNNEVIVNETMVKQLGVPSANSVLGKRLNIWGADRTVVGVVHDFYMGELRIGLQPLVLLNYYKENDMAALRIDPTNVTATMSTIDQTWNELFPEYVFKASFVDEQLDNFYVTERILLSLAQIFSLVAILIGCLGLYGLVLFMAETRQKEIGVRKVLGASVQQLIWLFGREFTWLLVIGFVLAAPVGWFLMNGWLQSYAYRIDLGWWVFALTLALVSGITLLTVGRVSLRAAMADPAKSIRTE